MGLVRLARSWNGGFCRSVRDEKGAVLDVVRFEPGEVLDLDELEMAAIQSDLGNALEEIELIDGKFRPIGFATANPNPADTIKKSPRRALAEQQAGEAAAVTKRSRVGKSMPAAHENTADK